MKKARKLSAWVTALAMLVSALPLSAIAASPADLPATNSVQEGDYSGSNTTWYASFNDLEENADYIVIVSRSSTDPLAPDNLVYLQEASSTDTGTLTVSFRANGADIQWAAACRPTKKDPSDPDTPVKPGTDDPDKPSSDGGDGSAALLIVGAGVAVAAVAVGVIAATAPVSVKGRVELADHTTLPGARISLLQDGKVVAQTTANEAGAFELKVKRGSYELTAVYTDANGQMVHKTIAVKAPARDLTVTF